MFASAAACGFSAAIASASDANGHRTSIATASVATNVTLYHINPLSYPTAPVDMDLGDVAGDLLFEFTQILKKFACRDRDEHPVRNDTPAPNSNACINTETQGKDLGVTKVVLSLSEQSYGPYATCNICVNGTSPLNHSHACAKGEYVCDCKTDAYPTQKVPCTASVGRENTTISLGSNGIGRLCSAGS